MGNDIDYFGPGFFEFWHKTAPDAMTLVDVHPEGHLYYYGPPEPIYVVTSEKRVFVNYPDARTAEPASGQALSELWARIMRRWHGDLTAALAKPAVLEAGDARRRYRRNSDGPRYAAERDPSTGVVSVGCFEEGDWCGYYLRGREQFPFPASRNLLPPEYPEEHRARIEELHALREPARE